MFCLSGIIFLGENIPSGRIENRYKLYVWYQKFNLNEKQTQIVNLQNIFPKAFIPIPRWNQQFLIRNRLRFHSFDFEFRFKLLMNYFESWITTLLDRKEELKQWRGTLMFHVMLHVFPYEVLRKCKWSLIYNGVFYMGTQYFAI